MFSKIAEPVSHALHLNNKAIKRTKMIPDEWKFGSVTTIHTQEEEHFVENYKPGTFLTF